MPLISVVIPTYNRAEYIGAALESVLTQRFMDYEIIVADDGSTDDTLECLKPYANKIQILTQPNKGEGGARNLGVAAAKGEYVAFLDSDDLWFPWTLECFAKSIQSHGAPTIIMGADTIFDDGQIPQAQEQALATERFNDYFAASRRLYWRGVNGNAFKRSAMRDIGPFDETRMVGLDIDYLLRLGAHPGFVKLSAPVTFAYRTHAGSITQNAELLHRGVQFLAKGESAGRYPGGPERRWDRRRLICLHIRSVSVRMLRAGRPNLGWDLYRRTAAWNFHLGKWKYLAGFPLMATFGRSDNNGKSR